MKESYSIESMENQEQIRIQRTAELLEARFSGFGTSNVYIPQLFMPYMLDEDPVKLMQETREKTVVYRFPSGKRKNDAIHNRKLKQELGEKFEVEVLDISDTNPYVQVFPDYLFGRVIVPGKKEKQRQASIFEYTG